MILALLGAEGMLRLITEPTFPERPFPNFTTMRVDPLLGWRNRPGIRRGEIRVGAAKSQALIETNSLGFRGPEVELPKPKGRIRIACVGDSGTFGIWFRPLSAPPVGANAATRPGSEPSPVKETVELDGYPQELRTDLAQAGRNDVDVVNAGVLGYTTSHALRQLVLSVLPLDPDIVIVRLGYNDHARAWSNELFVREPRTTLGRDLLYGLAPLRLTRLALASYHAALALGAPPTFPWVSPRDFEHNLTRFAELARARGFKLLLLDYPLAPPHRVSSGAVHRWLFLSGDPDEAQLREVHERYQELQRGVAQRENVPLLETKALLLDTAETSFSSTDLVHPARAGSERIAQLMLAELQNRHWLPISAEGGRTQRRARSR